MEADAGMLVAALCRKHGFGDDSYYKWRTRFGGMYVSEAGRLRDLEREQQIEEVPDRSVSGHQIATTATLIPRVT
jgi:transposase-like protein